jgi:ribosome biogenesis GTPase
LTHCEAATLDQQFPEIRHLLGQCQFRDCLHQEEPGCQIRAYGWERYPFYLLFLQEIQQRGWTDLKASDGSNARPESTDQAIQLHPSKSVLPQLSSQLRHPSRRRQRQQTQTWRGNLAALLEIGAVDEV